MHPRCEALASGNLSISVIAVIMMLMGGLLLVLGGIRVAAPLVGIPIAFFAFGILVRDGVVVAAGYGLLVLATVGI